MKSIMRFTTLSNILNYSLIFLFFSSSSMALGNQLYSNKKRLFKESKYNRCFYYEPVRKSAKFGWLNQRQAQKIANIKRKPVFAQNSPSDLRRVFVPKDWCKGS